MSASAVPAPRTVDYHPPDASAHPLVVIHRDDHLVVIDKPSGLLSVPGRGPERADCAWSRVLQGGTPDAQVVHRLDMATSGLLLFARGADMQRRLSQAFAERRVHKAYVAVVAGHVRDDAGEVDLPLICDWPNRPRQQVDHERGKPALTRWTVLARGEGRLTTAPMPDTRGFPAWTRVRLEPVTGRSHQLRVHMQSLGHAILGDELYADPSGTAAASRLLLHAQDVEFTHPAEEKKMALHCAAPF